MCGIGGYTGFGDEAEGRRRLEAMRRSLAHRGPDGHGLFVDAQAGAGLVHTRLSIIDPTERAAQPFAHSARWILAFNGEIYNYRELRRELESGGPAFRTASDTEAAAALLARHGPSSLPRLRGMFALALWDAHERSLLLARDPFGIKPLYVALQDGRLAFASEIRALLDGGWAPRERSPEGVAAYFARGSCDPRRLPVRGIQALAPGTWMRWQDGRLQSGRFQTIALDGESPSLGVRDFAQSLNDCIAAHLASDVPVGVFLSGGIDSSALLASLHAQRLPIPDSLTLAFPGTASDEAREAAALASHFGSRHTIRTPDLEREIAPWFREHLAAQDLPSIDGFNVACISRAARERGLKVILSGLGGDELLGGYPSFRNVPRLVCAARRLHALPGAARWSAALLARCGTKGRRLAEFLRGAPTPERAMDAYRRIFPDESLRTFGLTPPEPLPEEDDGFVQNGADLHTAVTRAEASVYLRHQLLRDADACSMAHGVELRVPFLDAALWNQAARLPPGLRYAPGKRLLARALPDLPREVFDRPKRGFSLPWDAWLSGALRREAETVPAEFRAHCTTWYQHMAWMAFTAWEARVLRA